MSDTAQAVRLIYEVVRGANLLLDASNRLNVGMEQVAELILRARTEGRSITTEDLADLAADTDDALDELRAEISRQRGGE